MRGSIVPADRAERDRPERDRGAADALGLVLIGPAVVGLALLVVSLGRGVDATAQVRSAAEAGAQAAALERSGADADAAARRAVGRALATGQTCASFDVAVAHPGALPSSGEVASVAVTVTCRVSDRGVEVIGRSYTEAVTAVATLDTFRARP